jgi:hypothetical protein
MVGLKFCRASNGGVQDVLLLRPACLQTFCSSLFMLDAATWQQGKGTWQQGTAVCNQHLTTCNHASSCITLPREHVHLHEIHVFCKETLRENGKPLNEGVTLSVTLHPLLNERAEHKCKHCTVLYCASLEIQRPRPFKLNIVCKARVPCLLSARGGAPVRLRGSCCPVATCKSPASTTSGPSSWSASSISNDPSSPSSGPTCCSAPAPSLSTSPAVSVMLPASVARLLGCCSSGREEPDWMVW